MKQSFAVHSGQSMESECVVKTRRFHYSDSLKTVWTEVEVKT